MCVSSIRAVKICALSKLLSYCPMDVPHGKEPFKDMRITIALHKVDLGFKNIGNTLKLSYSTTQAVRVIQRWW